MWGTFAVLFVAAAVGMIELPPLFRKRWYKEAAVHIASLLAGTVLSVIAIRLIALPSPLNIIVTVFKPINDWLFPK